MASASSHAESSMAASTAPIASRALVESAVTASVALERLVVSHTHSGCVCSKRATRAIVVSMSTTVATSESAHVAASMEATVMTSSLSTIMLLGAKALMVAAFGNRLCWQDDIEFEPGVLRYLVVISKLGAALLVK